MYLHIGMNVYLWSEKIIGIFEASLLLSSGEKLVSQEDNNNETTLKTAKILSHGITPAEAKSGILMQSNELHLSHIHYRTLEKRWNDCRRRGNLLDKSIPR
jgi:hypothetical protein